MSNSDGKWDFSDTDVSIYTYISILGSGFIEGIIVVFLQLATPTALALYYLFSEREVVEVALGTREMLFAILLYYLTKVTRDTIGNFLNVTGVYDTLSSRLRSLREIVWNNGTDSLRQSLGYTFDFFMNTGYICILYIFNMWILFNVSDPFEILGAVLFFEFLFDLDEEIARSRWWDEDKRYIRAGVVGLILQSTIKQKESVTKAAFVNKYAKSMNQEHTKIFKENVKTKKLPDGSDFLRGNESNRNIGLFTIQEEVEMLRENEKVKILGDKYKEPEKKRISFGGIFRSGEAIFHRHENYRAWSQWEKVLFCCPTPTLVPRAYKSGTKLQLSDGDFEFSDGLRAHKVNYSSRYEGRNLTGPFENWLWKVLNRKSPLTVGRGMIAQLLQLASYAILSFMELFRRTRKGNKFSRFFYKIFNLISVLVQIWFPFVTAALLISVYIREFYCILNLSFSGLEECKIEKYPWQ